MNKVLVFYAGMLYGEYWVDLLKPFTYFRDLPDGAYIRFPRVLWGSQWYASDFTPVLQEDVPKELLLLTLLLT